MKLRKGKTKEAGMSPERLDHVRELTAGWVADGIIPSLVVLAARKGEIVLQEAFGVLGPETDSSPLTMDTLFPFASVAKVITSTAVMILVEDGLLGLNRPVSEYVPEFIGEGKDAVMVHQLLTHTSGLNEDLVREHIEGKNALEGLPSLSDGSEREVYSYRDLGYDAPLNLEPGKEMSYCNFGFVLLAEIIGRVSGMAMDEFAMERIFKPLGMKDTYIIPPASVEKRIVRRPLGTPFADAENGYRKVADGAGSAYGTARDLAIFGQMFLNGGDYGKARILSPLSVREMTRNQIPGIGARFLDEFFTEAGWGLGWIIQENKKAVRFGSLHSSSTFFHSGADGVYLWVDPIYEIVGVYLSVELENRPDGGHKWNADLFANAVTAAVN